MRLVCEALRIMNENEWAKYVVELDVLKHIVFGSKQVLMYNLIIEDVLNTPHTVYHMRYTIFGSFSIYGVPHMGIQM